MSHKIEKDAPRRRRLGLLWLACAAAAAMVLLGSNGTLSSWTTAMLNNTSNTAQTAKAVILKEANSAGTVTCLSSADPTNSATCATIDKYGGTASPISPGGSQVTTVTFTNIGSGNGTSFSVAPGICGQTPAAGSGTPAAANVCTNGDLTVAISCSPGTSYSAGSAWTGGSDLAYPAAAPPTDIAIHTATGGDLNAGASWTCRFTVALSASAGITDQNIQISQPLLWTLNG